MFRAVHRSSSGALTVFAASGLHTHVVTGRSQVWVGIGLGYLSQFPLRLRSPHAYVNQRLQIQLELLMMSGVPLETCWAFNERWNNKFCYKVASWLFLLNHNFSVYIWSYIQWISNNFYINIWRILIPANIWYHARNTQYIPNIRRHTVSAHHLNTISCTNCLLPPT
jgi:hypothetical protein